MAQKFQISVSITTPWSSRTQIEGIHALDIKDTNQGNIPSILQIFNERTACDTEQIQAPHTRLW